MSQRKKMLMFTTCWMVLWFFPGFCNPTLSWAYTPPSSNRLTSNFNEGWKFQKGNLQGAESNSYDDSSWNAVKLPHTWNNLDGQDGGDNYYRGAGWYRKHFKPDSSYTNRHVYIQFDGANIVTDVYVNGRHAGRHSGGFARFRFDITPYILLNQDNVLAVKTDNTFNGNIPPHPSADFTFFGGLYRDVSLLITDKLQIDVLDFASSGVYIKQVHVTPEQADLEVVTKLRNDYDHSQTAYVRTVIVDVDNNIVKELTAEQLMPGFSSQEVIQHFTIYKPHLWQGKPDPYLYQVFVELSAEKPVATINVLNDLVQEPLGIRYFTVDAVKGFFLNGKYIDLYGVSRHQDQLNKGWALTAADHLGDFNLIKEIGANAVRLAHYQHAQTFYDLCDKDGLIVWAEVPVINRILDTPQLYENATQQLMELIRQNFNHPSILFWSIANEITLFEGPDPSFLIASLNTLARQEDPTRLITLASCAPAPHATNWFTDLIAFNRYDGWYYGERQNIGLWADKMHLTYPHAKMGISEYGAGASIYQHELQPAQPVPNSHWHPEEYQNLFHETYWQSLKTRPYLWCKFIWNMCDFAVDPKNEGDTPGRNDKGLVTYDRKVKKDAFFWYKANWTTEPVVYITSKRFSPRTEALTPVKVYSNCDKVALYLNESLVSEKVPEEAIVSWPDITLKPGLNIIKTIGQKAGKQDCLDYACWTYLSPDSIKASSNQAGNEAPGAFDKNTQTRWSATSSAYPQWWRIDLGGLKNIKGVAIDWYYSQLRAYQYKLETSQNDITYQIVADKTTNQQTGNTQDLFEKQARYVRITVAGCSLANAWSAINEITFIGLSEIIPNLAPQVWAGDDQIRLLTTTIKLLGQVQDDDLPAGQALNIQWSLQSGPGQVTFTNPKALETQTTFSRPGVFEFKLTISDGEFTSTDLVKIDIRDNAWPIAPYARINFQPSTLSIPPDYLPDYGQTFGPKNGYVYGWNMDHTSLVRQRGINPDPRLDTICHFLSGGAWEFRLPIGLYNVTVSVGDAAFAKTYTINVEGVNYWQSVSLSANQFLQMSKNITVNDGILTVDAGLSAEKSTRLNYIEIAVVLNDNKPPAVEAGPDETITLPVDTITLEGQVTDDGKPLGSPLQISWVKESGPGVVTFGDPYSAQTTAIFAACGTYVLKLSASDGDTSAADTLTVNVMGQQLVEPLKINFQSPGSDVPADYLPDYGEIYGLKSAFNHFYGWNYDCSSLTRDRNKNMDQRLDTFTHFHAGGFWEIQVPNGDYHVTVSIGDAAYSSVCTINVEGSNYWSAVPLVANQFLQLVKTVKVTDGRLTVDCGQSPAMQTKINYAEIAPLN